jgi:NADH-quinone oxidoreductase subunit G
MSQKQVTITLNGKSIVAPVGANVLQVAKDHGISIAHYCYHEGLSIAGVCRLCLVKVNDNPKPTPSCNLTVQEGMKIDSESPDIQKMVRWGLQFHLANHPLDCPICDQAGECILQESYMEYGFYDSNMTEPKVKKSKVVDLGPTIVLDKERCILCARCTRFTHEVTQTDDLGIFERGDRSEIGTYHNRPFVNDYSLNTVDICPVGALTSKDFRFKQRVWFTQKSESICIKCATGCNITVWHNPKGAYRVQPKKNMSVNQWWMCDQGRNVYDWLNVTQRYTQASMADEGGRKILNPSEARKALGDWVRNREIGKIAWILSPQHTVEEYEAVFELFKTWEVAPSAVFYWYDRPESLNDFDGLLLRGDKSPNTRGLQEVAEAAGFPFDTRRFNTSFEANAFEAFAFFAPENLDAHPSFHALMGELPDRSAIWLSSRRLPSPALEAKFDLILPTQTYAEKLGTLVNHAGIRQSLKPFLPPNLHIHSLIQLCEELKRMPLAEGEKVPASAGRT